MTEIILTDGASSFAPEQDAQTYQINGAPAAIAQGTITQARNSFGSPVTGGAIGLNSIINVGGSETSVKAAVAAGLVQANPDGTFSMMSQEARAQAQRQKAEARAQAEAAALGADGPVETVDTHTEQTIASFANHVSPSTVMGAINDLSKGLDVRSGYIDHAASEMGIEPSQVRTMMDQVRGAFEAQARSVVNRAGLPADDVFAWAYQNKPEMMQHAIRQQATMRTTSGYQKVAQAYLENLDTINPDALLGAQLGDGLEIKKASNGKLVLKTPKGEFEYRAAVRSGLIKISKAGGSR